MGNFLRRLREAEEGVKRRWLAGITAVVMVGIVYLWLAYFNTLIAAPSGTAPEPAGGKESNFSAWQTVRQGGAASAVFAGDLARSLWSAVLGGKKYVIVPGN